jgi:hypothetical protein
MSQLRVSGLGGLVALVALATLPQGARAQSVVYNNGTFNTSSATNISISTTATADDFLVPAGGVTFNTIRFWAVDTVAGTLPNFSGTISWFLYSASTGTAPNQTPSGAVLASGTTSTVSVINTGSTAGGANNEIAQLTFLVPSRTLTAGRYWLRLKEGTAAGAADGTSIAWIQTTTATTTAPDNNVRRDASPTAPTTWATAGTGNMAFQLMAAPEPGSLGFLGLGALSALGVLRRRRK